MRTSCAGGARRDPVATPTKTQVDRAQQPAHHDLDTFVKRIDEEQQRSCERRAERKRAPRSSPPHAEEQRKRARWKRAHHDAGRRRDGYNYGARPSALERSGSRR